LFGIKLKKFRILEPFDTLQDRTRKFILPDFTKEILKSIKLIKPRIHNIKLSSDYLYREIQKELGTLVRDEKYEPYSILPYKNRAYRNFEGSRFTIYYNPNAGFLPKSMITFKYAKHYPLFELGNRLPELEVSSVEYALDFFCKNNGRPQNVRNLFLLFMHYLYRRNVRTTKYYTNRENFTYYIGAEKDFKIYERAEDKLEQKDDAGKSKGWKFKDLDRVRLEYTLDRDAAKDYNLEFYIEFLMDCKFSDVMNGLFEFRKFKNHIEELPKEWQEYQLKKGGVNNGFQDEYLLQKELGNIKSLKKSTDKSIRFIPIHSKLRKLIKSYNIRWRNKTQLSLSSK
jgi:hypothetical protein